jgi:NADPH-dependent 2,4-dienoyl-CoA reductase/sulfur reductase-like enzyme/nitrite reductase/ring-hydroxylating ferredoxin subunit
MTHREHEVASLDDFPAGDMRQIEVDGTKILLVREGHVVHAIGAECPHAGGPLAEGVRRGNRLVCPWHKATFCIRTGAVLEPPAVDPLPRFDVRIDGSRVLVAMPAKQRAPSAPTGDRRCFVIVGAGAAGAVAAQTLREIGFAGRIVMLDRDNRVPYDRTVLSKYFLSGEPGGEKSPLQTQSFYRQQHIERRTADVIHIDAQQRRITCADGSSLDYNAALLATGAAPRRPPIPGADLRDVFLLRSRADAQAILAAAERSERVVVLGASFIGMEVAASLRERGLEVTVAAKERVPFEKQLGAQIGAAFIGLHERRGVNFRFGQSIAAIDGGPAVRAVVLDTGERLAADLVVVGFGVTPVTAYAQNLGVSEDGGIRVDAHLRVTDGLYAAGDIASFPYRGDGDPIRVEHWRVAEQQGRVAALNMSGQQVAYDAVPVFWTIQYLKRLDYIGHTSKWDELVVHGDLEKPEFLAYYVRNGLVAAAVGFDRDKETAALVELFTARKSWTADDLGDSPASVLASMPTA